MEEFSLDYDGFIGRLYIPETDQHPGKVLILLGGSDGSFALTCLVAELYAKQGIHIMATAYWNMEGLPMSLYQIPLEYIGNVAEYLKDRGFEKVGVWGISKGAELALTAGSYLPEKLSCVIAASPICIATQGMTVPEGRGMAVMRDFTAADGSCFTWQGKSIPYMRYPESAFASGRKRRELWKHKEMYFRYFYEELVASPAEDAVLPVEKIGGPVLLFSGMQDVMWPAWESANILMKRMDERGFAYPHKHITYEHGSHYMVPIRLKSSFLFRAERKYKREMPEIHADILKKTMDFIREQW